MKLSLTLLTALLLCASTAAFADDKPAKGSADKSARDAESTKEKGDAADKNSAEKAAAKDKAAKADKAAKGDASDKAAAKDKGVKTDKSDKVAKGDTAAKGDKTAKGGDAAKKPKALKGKVVTVAGNKLVLATGNKKESKEVAVAVDADTKVTIEGKESVLADLKEGQQVTITPAEGTAQAIVVATPKPKKEATDKAAKPAQKSVEKGETKAEAK